MPKTVYSHTLDREGEGGVLIWGGMTRFPYTLGLMYIIFLGNMVQLISKNVAIPSTVNKKVIHVLSKTIVYNEMRTLNYLILNRTSQLKMCCLKKNLFNRKVIDLYILQVLQNKK